MKKFIVGILLSLLLGCSSVSGTSTPSNVRTVAATSSPILWMFGQVAISTVAQDSTASQILSGRTVYIILSTVEPIPQTPPSVPAGWNVVWIYRWTSEEQMATDFASGSVPSWITVVMYDNELATAPATPTNETDNPPYYTVQSANVAHTNGRQFWMTAGLQTSNPNYPGGTSKEASDEWATSSVWDGYAIQSQTAINDITSFDNLISERVSKAEAHASGPLFFSAGIGDFANGTFATLQQNELAVPTIPSTYAIWMNFGPHAGAGCTDPSVCPIPSRYDMIPSLIDYFK